MNPETSFAAIRAEDWTPCGSPELQEQCVQYLRGLVSDDASVRGRSRDALELVALPGASLCPCSAVVARSLALFIEHEMALEASYDVASCIMAACETIATNAANFETLVLPCLAALASAVSWCARDAQKGALPAAVKFDAVYILYVLWLRGMYQPAPDALAALRSTVAADGINDMLDEMGLHQD